MRVWSDETLADTTRLEALYKIVKEGHETDQPDSAFHYALLYYEFAEKRGLKKQMSRILNRQGIYRSNTGDYEGAIEYLNRSLKISEDLGDKRRVASSLNNIGRVNEKQGNYVEAKKYFLSCLDIFEEIGFQRGSLITMNNLATIYLYQGDYEVAIEFYTNSLKKAEQLDSKDIILNLLNNIGLVYERQSDDSKAIEYYTRSFEMAKKISNKTGMALTLNNIGNIHETRDEDAKAIDFHNRSFKIRKEINDQAGMVSSLINIGSLYKKLMRYDEAIDYQTRGLKIAKKIGFQRGVAFSLRNIGATYQARGDAAKSILYGTKALAKSQELGLVVELMASADILYQEYEQIGNHQASLKMYKLYIDMRDSIENIEVQKTVLRKEIEYKYQKQTMADSIAFVKQRELDSVIHQAALKKEAYQRYAWYGGLLLILILLGIYFRIRFIKREAETEMLLQEIKLLKVDAIIKLASRDDLNQQLILDKVKIEQTINNSLNPSDWSILVALYNNPSIGNREIADEVSLSVAGVRSSLKKMYNFFYINKSSNQRVILVMEATKISNNSLKHK